jgi:hypothetical protein
MPKAEQEGEARRLRPLEAKGAARRHGDAGAADAGDDGNGLRDADDERRGPVHV